MPEMRRFRQQLNDAETETILRRGQSAVLAVHGEDGYPYAVPVNYAYHAGHIYIHSAGVGHKISAIRHDPKVSLCVVDYDEIIPEELTDYFRSAIAFGTIRILESDAERREALRILCDKYAPGVDPGMGDCLKRVCMLDITIEKVTGKAAIELVNKEK